jgi:hypothetical protein
LNIYMRRGQPIQIIEKNISRNIMEIVSFKAKPSTSRSPLLHLKHLMMFCVLSIIVYCVIGSTDGANAQIVCALCISLVLFS